MVRVTKSSPRRSLSWLKRKPEQTNMPLRGEVVNLVGLEFRNDAIDAETVGHVAIVQMEYFLFEKVRNAPLARFGAGATNDAVNFVTFREQKLRKVRTVLTGDTGNECNFRHDDVPL